MLKFKNSLVAVLAASLFISLFTGCAKKTEKRIVIWTSNSEFAPYVELYNETHNQKAVLVYKENPAASLPPLSDELQPDIITGPWLRNDKTSHNFRSLNFLFDRQFITSNSFYYSLLKSGASSGVQYLLPVSFNLPVVIFSSANESKVSDKYTITLDEMQNAGKSFNRQDKRGRYTNIGFAPQSNEEFLYKVVSVKGAAFKEGKNHTFAWNKDGLSSSLAYLNDWITKCNTSTEIESDFVYKYLSVTDDKRVTSGRTLFAYTTSDKLFQLSNEQLSKVDFRWLKQDDSIPVEDHMIMMGISRNVKNMNGASDFISWFYSIETQKAILERKNNMNLEINTFGIAGGFSSVKEVNERLLPVYYTTLLSNIPQAGTLKVPEKKPAQWELYKNKVVMPYLKEVISSSPDKKITTLSEHYDEFKKQRFHQ